MDLHKLYANAGWGEGMDVAILQTQINATHFQLKKSHSDRWVLVHNCIMGNQGKVAGISKICFGIQS